MPVPETSTPLVVLGAVLALGASSPALAQAACTADLDRDGQVNGADLAVVLAYWNTGNVIADLDGSGSVGGADLAIVLSQWNFTCPTNPFCDSVVVTQADGMMVVTTTGLPCHATGPFDGSYFDPDTGQSRGDRRARRP